MEGSSPDTPEAPPDVSPDPSGDAARPRNPLAVWVAVSLLVIAVAAALSSAVHTYRSEQRRRAQAEAVALSGAAAQQRAVGSQDARLKIEACLGPCIAPLFDAFAACAEAWPDRIRAEFIPYDSPEGQKFCNEHGEDLACIFFNGRNRFTLGEGDSRRKVHFYGPPEGEAYAVRDLPEVLRMQMEEVYGEVPPDFDEKVTAFEAVDLDSGAEAGH